MLDAAGPHGRSAQGPDLSGLSSPFYPPTAPGSRPWSASDLGEWLRNPRASRPATTMLPVALSDDERRHLLVELGLAGIERPSKTEAE